MQKKNALLNWEIILTKSDEFLIYLTTIVSIDVDEFIIIGNSNY